MENGFTFSDVLLVPRRSSITSRKEVDAKGRFSRNISLNAPIVSANMDTVTEAEMAIGMARCGGLGVIHRFLTVEEEVAEVEKVKRAESIIIEEPYTLSPKDTVQAARRMMQRHHVSGLLVVDAQKKLVGILTQRDLMFSSNSSKTLAREVMTPKPITAPYGTRMEKAEEILRKHKIEKLPLVDKEGRLKGLITASDLIHKRQQFPLTSKNSKGKLLVGAAVGVVGDYIERSAALLKAGADVLVVDVAHGHADHVISAVKKLKSKFEADVVAGNVATYEGAKDLVEAGADGVRVGVGPGSICTTRIVTGCGVPQLSAVLDCARITQEAGIPITADGGIRDSGDMTKALAAGASCVMMGSLLAGTDEAPGWIVVRNGLRYKVYRGMASLAATISRKQKERGEAPLQEEDIYSVVPEGVEAAVPYRGKLSEVVQQLVGGVRSGMSYCGARSLPELWKKAKFIRITSASWKESQPHVYS